MQEIIIVSVCCWFIAEGSFLMQNIKHWMDIDKITILDCGKCLSFWVALYWFHSEGIHSLVYAMLCSSLSIMISKVYNRI